MKNMNPSSPHYNENVMSSEPKKKLKVKPPRTTIEKIGRPRQINVPQPTHTNITLILPTLF